MSLVLVVDDNSDIRQLVLQVLRLESVDGEEAETGLAALERLDHDPLPDLVVLDVQMPRLDGWDTLRRIRGSARTAGVPVLLCTVKAGAVDTALAGELDADGYVFKPFAIDRLGEEIQAVLASTPEERAARRRAARAKLTETDAACS